MNPDVRSRVAWSSGFSTPDGTFVLSDEIEKKIAKNIFGKNKVSFCLINCHLVSVVKNKFEEYAMNTNFVRFIVFR